MDQVIALLALLLPFLLRTTLGRQDSNLQLSG
jgi:hypothetical protein